MRRSAGRSSGFTLVEVMVALAIVSVVVFSMLLAAAAAARDAQIASRYRTARLLADQLMGQVYLGEVGKELGEEQGTFESSEPEANFPHVHWEVSVAEEEWLISTAADREKEETGTEQEERDPAKLRRVRVRTWFEGFDGNDEGEITLETVIGHSGSD